VHAEIDRSLQSISKEVAVTLVKKELRTIVPALSILFDLQSFIDEAAGIAEHEDVPAAQATQLLATIGQQLAAARELVTERLDELAGAARGASEHAAVADLIYAQERTLTGARSALGDFLALSTSTRVLSAHVGAVARARSQAVRGAAPPQPSPRNPRSAAQLLGRGRGQARAAGHPDAQGGGGGTGGGSSGGPRSGPPVGQPHGAPGKGAGGRGGGGRGQGAQQAGGQQ